MKHLFFLLTLLLCLPLSAQQKGMSMDATATIADRLAAYGQLYPQETVFLHMDNTVYYLGDTLYYKAYVMRADRHQPTDISGVLYVELLNNDGYLVERQTVCIEDGQGVGSFALHDTLYAGFYELRAYTRWQLNWGVTVHPHSACSEGWFLTKENAREYFRDYDKLYSRVFPVYDKPEEAGEYLQHMSLRPLQRYMRDEKRKDRADVGIYPEGGTWVSGTRQRLAFEARDDEGRHLDGQITLKDSHGNVVAQASTEHRGRGVLDVFTRAGETYSAEFLHEKHRDDVRLPTLEPQGISMRLEHVPGGVNISCTGSTPHTGPLMLSVLSSGILQDVFELTDSLLHVPTEEYPSGVLQLTLYDAAGRVWADRLCFVWNQDMQTADVAVSGLSPMCRPYEHVTMQLQATPGAVVSVAVRDGSTSPTTCDNGSMASELLLCSQIKGFVEQPDYYFEADDSVHRRHLDLLLMVQGWRRYRWEELAGDSPAPDIQAEKTPTYVGEVTDYTPLESEDDFFMGSPRSGTTLEKALNDRKETGKAIQFDAPANGTHASQAGCGPQIEEMIRFTAPTLLMEDMVLEYGQRMGYTHTEQFDSLRERMQKTFWQYSSAMFDVKGLQHVAPLKADVQVHAEFVQPQQAGLAAVTGDQLTRSEFRIQSPRIQSPHFLYLTAGTPGKDTAAWIVPDAAEQPRYNVRLKNFFPRFVKPYAYYQTHLPQQAKTGSTSDRRRMGEVDEMPELTVTSRHKGLRAVNLSRPTCVLDAYDAFNQTVDAGLSTSWYAGSLSYALNVTRLVCGDMGTQRPYRIERRWDGRNLSTDIPREMQREYNHLERLARVAVYTDYAPRMEGDPRYMASSQPSVTLNMELLPEGTRRAVYRDRRYIMPGYNVCADFYQPHYEQTPPPSHADHRRTLYWNPQVQLDSTGCATISFYGNGHTSVPIVSAEGITADGNPLWPRTASSKDEVSRQSHTDQRATEAKASRITIRAQIVDAASGEPLPYARIYAPSHVGTLSNKDGQFTLTTDARDCLQISYMGYNTLSLRADSIPNVITLREATRVMGEISVQGIGKGFAKVLERTRRQLTARYSQRKMKRSSYFFRLTNVEGKHKEVAEAFMEACSNINLRQMTVLSGRPFQKEDIQGDDTLSQLFVTSNLHNLLALAPMVQDVAAWANLKTPLSFWKESRMLLAEGRYVTSSQIIHPDDGHTQYCLHMEPSEASRGSKLLSGTLYVDSATARLLSFDGTMHGYSLRLNHGDGMPSTVYPLHISVHVDYTYARGFAEVESIRSTLNYGAGTVRLLAFNLQDRKPKARRKIEVKDNLMAAIKKAGYDRALWTEDIIQRTEEEDRVVTSSDR